ncbi:MAG: TolC family protein [Bacteroidales bacterium]|nr:TolC family protein [Bacteroidales bacterium]MDD3989258.1 TolC family protein [Bacteroidales bacterium]
MINRLIFIQLLLLFAIPVSLKGEKRLTLQECVALALEKNYSVTISYNQVKMAENNVNLSPFLPSLSLSVRQNASSNNQREISQGGEDVNTSANVLSFQNGLNFNWPIFDGFSMFATRDKQKELLNQGKYNFRSVVENLVMKVSTQYYLIISLHNQVKLLEELVGISQTRFVQAYTRYTIGKDSGLEYKQAKVYLNSDSSSLLMQMESLKNAYIELYRLMNLPLDSEYLISDSIVPEPVLVMEDVIRRGLENNTSLLADRAGERVAGLDLKIAQSLIYPTLNFSAGYNYNLDRNNFFPSRFDQSNGFNWGFSLSVPIFDGFENRRRVKNARITAENARLATLLSSQELESELRQLYNLYRNNLRMVDFEKENKETAYLNLDAAMEKYRLGSLSGIEFRDIQLSYMNAYDRMLNSLYETKVKEITLHLLSGDLFPAELAD